MNRKATAALLILMIAIFGFFMFQIGSDNRESRTTPKSPEKPDSSQACTTEACIEITQVDGQKFKLNDFRFQPNHCISFVVFGSGEQRSTCGEYKLDWIGPDNSENKNIQAI